MHTMEVNGMFPIALSKLGLLTIPVQVSEKFDGIGMRSGMILWSVSSGPDVTIIVELDGPEPLRGKCRRALDLSDKRVKLNKRQSMLSE